MTGVKFRYEITEDALRPVLGRLVEAAQDLSPAMDEIGSAMVASTLFRFEDGKGPDGQTWPPSLRAIQVGGQTLVDKGFLRTSIVHEFGGDFAEWGSNLVYAATHQFGDEERGIPERPYLGFSDDDLDEIGAILSDHLRQAINQ